MAPVAPAPAGLAPAVLGLQADAFFQASYARALVIEVEGPIFGRFHWYLNNRLDAAQRADVDLVIIQLTSPGGDLEYSLQLARRLRDIDWAKTLVTIPQEAISGGAILSLGADRIVMQSGALIGDAGPIHMGMDGQFRHAEEKVVSYLAGAVRELAAAKGRPAALAEAMVDRSAILVEAVDKTSGRRTVLNEREAQDPTLLEQFEIGDELPESGQNRFLTLGAERARQLQLCEGVVDSQQDLLAKMNIASIESTRLTWVDKTVFVLNRPWLTAVLLIAGLIGLYIELMAPGISVAGLTSVCCFGVFFWSHALGGTSGWLEVLLFVLGILCVLAELFILPGFGVFGFTGLGLVILSLVMASQEFVLPSSAGEWQQLQVNTLMVLGSVLAVIVLFFAQLLILDSVPGLNRFRLAAPDVAPEPKPGVHDHSLLGGRAQAIHASVGAQGVAESDLRPSGKVLLADQLLDVVTEGDYVDAGSTVEVIATAGNRIVVRRVK